MRAHLLMCSVMASVLCQRLRLFTPVLLGTAPVLVMPKTTVASTGSTPSSVTSICSRYPYLLCSN